MFVLAAMVLSSATSCCFLGGRPTRHSCRTTRWQVLSTLLLAVLVIQIQTWSSLLFTGVGGPGKGGSEHSCEVIVIRHGETSWNRELRVQGTSDIPLNEKGSEQAALSAQAIAASYSSREVLVISSQLQRAADTAKAVATALSKAELREDERLNEWNMGVIEGMRKDDAAEIHPDAWAIFSKWCTPSVSEKEATTPIKGGESMAEVKARAVSCIEETCKECRDGKPLIVITHGGVLGQLLRHADGLSDRKMPDRPPATNACISKFLVRPGGSWQVISWADTAHLVGDAAPSSAVYG